jgi:hypothetical protein
MIQLQYSSATGSFQNKVFWSDSSITSSYVVLTLTSSFAGDYSVIQGDIVSNKANNINGGWVLFEISSSNVPTQSGYYEANIYEGCIDQPVVWNEANVKWNEAKKRWNDWAIGCLQKVIWSQATDKWNEVEDAWNNYKESSAGIEELITQERIFVSGSDYDTLDVYEYQEQGYYTVYNG